MSAGLIGIGVALLAAGARGVGGVERPQDLAGALALGGGVCLVVLGIAGRVLPSLFG